MVRMPHTDRVADATDFGHTCMGIEYATATSLCLDFSSREGVAVHLCVTGIGVGGENIAAMLDKPIAKSSETPS